MNKYKCIEPKNYALTEGKEYTPTKVTEDYIYITNDDYNQVKYSLELFDELPETIAVVRTIEDVINSIEIEGNLLFFHDYNNEKVEIN